MLHVYSNQKGKNANLKKINVLSYGINKYTTDTDVIQGPHAEHDALLHLKYNCHKNKKRKERINICVVRFSKTGKMQNSKPCHKCIEIMTTLPEKIGYKIDDIYYSSDECIVLTTLKELQEEKEHHYSRLSRVYSSSLSPPSPSPPSCPNPSPIPKSLLRIQ